MGVLYLKLPKPINKLNMLLYYNILFNAHPQYT